MTNKWNTTFWLHLKHKDANVQFCQMRDECVGLGKLQKSFHNHPCKFEGHLYAKCLKHIQLPDTLH
jgi:hypothetical protein